MSTNNYQANALASGRVTWSEEEARAHVVRYRTAVQKARSISAETLGSATVADALLAERHPLLHGDNCILRALEHIDDRGATTVDESLIRSLQQVAFLLEPAIAISLAVVDPEFPDLGTHVLVSSAKVGS